MKPQSLVRNIMTVGGWTLISRGTGFARDVMMAAYLGTGPVAEATTTVSPSRFGL